MEREHRTILAGNLLLIEEAEDAVIIDALTMVGASIEDYCQHYIETEINIDGKDIFVRYDLGEGQFIVFKSAGRNGKTSKFEGTFCTLELAELSSTEQESIPVRIMFDVFNWS